MADPVQTPEPAGYPEILGLRSRSPLRVAEQVRAGLSYTAFEHFRRHALVGAGELAELVHIPPRTLARRRAAGRLAPDESDRLVRLARVFALALALFEGNAAGARHWLATPLPALNGEAPMKAATTDPGAREVEALIGRLEHGVPA